MGRTGYLIVLLVLILPSWMCQAGQENEEFSSIDEAVLDLKKEVIKLNRDLFILKEQLLFPSNSQLSVFISMGNLRFFSLDSVEVKMDDKTVAQYLYTAHEIQALQAGGVHRVYLGNAKAGKHDMTVFFRGKDVHGREIRRAETYEIEKRDREKFIEISIMDDKKKQQLGFSVKEWE